jgi:predicted amidohydrolase
MGGHSVVVDPSGGVRFEASAGQEEATVVEIDPAEASAWRAQFPALHDRRL